MNNITYDLDFLCTYHIIDNSNNYSTICYQSQILQAFKLKTYDCSKIDNTIIQLYNLLKNNKYILETINIITNNMSFFKFLKENNKNIHNSHIFQIFFSYDFFFIFHQSLIEYCKNNYQDNHFIDFKNYVQKLLIK
tara:strand:+ start:6666 stop:7073 length:408 start_codon:yes stop_codon:yes gene_type:complete